MISQSGKRMIEPLKLQLKQLLEHMDVPTIRMELKPEDIRWLNRNLYINNRESPHFEQAKVLVGQLLRESI